MRGTSTLRTTESVELNASDESARLDFGEIFGRVAPVEVDLGCGDGTFLATVAAQNPERDFLGIDRQVRRVRSTCGKVARAGLANVRVLRAEIPDALKKLPESSVDAFHLLFSDPWPKRRHQPRRVFNAAFLAAVARALKPDGRLHAATDQSDYFQAMRALAETGEHVKIVDPADASKTVDLPMTKFETLFRKLDTPIYRLELVKVSPVR